MFIDIGTLSLDQGILLAQSAGCPEMYCHRKGRKKARRNLSQRPALAGVYCSIDGARCAILSEEGVCPKEGNVGAINIDREIFLRRFEALLELSLARSFERRMFERFNEGLINIPGERLSEAGIMNGAGEGI
jgi:hypothetical protein